MNLSILFALMGACLSTGNDLVYRKSALGKDPRKVYQFYFLASAFSAIFALLLSIISDGGFRFSGVDLLYGIGLGILSFSTYILFLLSFNGSNTSTSVTIYRMSLIPSIILAMAFLNEVITIRRASAIVLCISSMLIFAGKSAFAGKKSKHLLFSMGAFLCGGALSFFNKLAVMNGGVPFHLLFFRFLTVGLLSGALLSMNKPSTFGIRDIKIPALSGLLLMLGVYCTLLALKSGDISVVIPITQLGFVLVAIISWLAFKEKMNLSKMVGLLSAVLAVILIA